MEEKWTIVSYIVIGIKEGALLGDGVPSMVDRSMPLTKPVSSAIMLQYRECHPLLSFAIQPSLPRDLSINLGIEILNPTKVDVHDRNYASHFIS